MTQEEIRAVNRQSGFAGDRQGKRSSLRPMSRPALLAAFAPKAIRKFAEARFQ